jgi:hypothetical protein
MSREDVFAITYNADMAEGRGQTITLGYARTRELANAIVSDKRFSKYCCMGFHDAQSCVTRNVNPAQLAIFESVDELYDFDVQSERKKALEKLTQRERDLLGLA